MMPVISAVLAKEEEEVEKGIEESENKKPQHLQAVAAEREQR